MQTFLPYQSFAKSAEVLDNQRLGKQRVEAWQILKINRGEDRGSMWSMHPAVKMWKDFDLALAFYGFAMCSEWIKRGYKDNLRDYFHNIIAKELGEVLEKEHRTQSFLPDFIFNQQFIDSHRSNLVRKKPEYYRTFFPEIPDNLPYWWPTHAN